MSADCFVPAVTILLFFTQNNAFRSHLLTQKCYHSLPSSVNGTDCQKFKITIIIIKFFKFGPILRTWPFFLLTERAAEAQQCKKTSLFTGTDLTLGATTISETIVIYLLFLLTCSLPVSLCHTRLGPGAELHLQQPPPFSVLPVKDLKSQSWDRTVGWERILPTEYLWQF